MLRILTVIVFLATLGMAGVLYKIKYDTRSLQLETVRLRQKIAVERQQVAVLKAEWSILTQPGRIERLATSIGLVPLSPKQIISFHDLESLPLSKSVPLASLDQGAVTQSADTLSGTNDFDATVAPYLERAAVTGDGFGVNDLIGDVIIAESSEVSDGN